MPTPRCPHCNAQGLKHLNATPVGLFLVVYCDKCGAIYGVVPNPQAMPTITADETQANTQDQPKPTPQTPSADQSDTQHQLITPERVAVMLTQNIRGKRGTMYHKFREEGQ